MTPPIDYKKIAHEFPQVPEWTKVVKWSPEDGCYVGYIEGPLGPCCHGDDPATVREELAEIEREWRALLGMTSAALSTALNSSGDATKEMNPIFGFPPIHKAHLTPPDDIASRLQSLIGTPFKLTGKPRTDGSNVRKLVSRTFARFPLPKPCSQSSYSIIPPREKGLPRILLEYVDTYIVTTGNAYNLQVWNRNPASDSIQVEYNFGETLSSKDVRFVFLRVDPQTQTISSILVLTPDYIEDRFGRFGKPTIKHQIIIPPKVRGKVLARNPPGIFCSDTSALSQHVTEKYAIPTSPIGDKPILDQLFSLRLLREMLVEGLIGEPLDQMATKNRGQALERLVACLLGYDIGDAEILEGNFPDIPNQALEVKVQDSPTVDLGRFSPQFEECVPSCPSLTTLDVRYLIALTDAETSIVQGIILCPGEKLGEHFSYVSDTSFKCQRSIPMSFFDAYQGQALYNP